jgi:hypothetical protein
MKPQPESSTQDVLAGLVERVTFHNAENGFCVRTAFSAKSKKTAQWSGQRGQFEVLLCKRSIPTKPIGSSKHAKIAATRSR